MTGGRGPHRSADGRIQVVGQPRQPARGEHVGGDHRGIAALPGRRRAALAILQPPQHDLHALCLQLRHQFLAQGSELLGGVLFPAARIRATQPTHGFAVDERPAVVELQFHQDGNAAHEAFGGLPYGDRHFLHFEARGDAGGQKTAAYPVGRCDNALFHALEQGGVDRVGRQRLAVALHDVGGHRHQLGAMFLAGRRGRMQMAP
ncbi:hypothetical protein D3C72_1543410 [compost metagenome]